jgi:deoxyribodipyrimidine photo-lyase
MTNYKDTRNGLLGTDFSTKLSAWLALGCITARQIHVALLDFEDARTDVGKDVEGYGKGENNGTKAVRFELLWRDYMRLCTRKFGPKLFRLSGFREDDSYPWKTPSRKHGGTGHSSGSDHDIDKMIERFLNGTTGMGIIDASQRELYHTGYTSNRARQNVASFLTKRLGIDWRVGAEWYECMLIDYDLSSNWGNWQYVAGVGNDPRGEARVFNPVKQAYDYDPEAAYVRAWVQELRGVDNPGECFQAWTIRDTGAKKSLGLDGLEMVEDPLRRIEFTIGRKAKTGGGQYGGSSRRGAFRGGSENTGGEKGLGRSGGQSRGGYGGRGYASGRTFGKSRGGGRENRMGMMEKDAAAQRGYNYTSEKALVGM